MTGVIIDDGSYPPGFFDWFRTNNHIFHGFVRIARQAQERGIHQWSADAVIQVLRWETALQQDADDGFKINNNYVSGLARAAMAVHPDLVGFFKTRVVR